MKGEAPTLGLVTFKDTVTNLGLTCSIDSLRDQINSLSASGGDDCPEASNLAALEALDLFPLIGSDAQQRGGRLSIATDASARNPGLGPLVSIRAAVRGVAIDSILTGDCFEESTLVGDPLEQISSNDASENAGSAPKAEKVDDPLTSRSARTQLRALAESTGGVLFEVERVEVDEVVQTLLDLGSPESALLSSRRIELASVVPKQYDIVIDDEMSQSVTFMITASSSSTLPALTLRRPSGELVNADDSDATFRVLSSVITVSVESPSPGNWQVEVLGDGEFNLRVFGQTPLRLNSLRLQRQAHEGELRRPEVDLVPLNGQPVIGTTIFGDLRFTLVPTDLRVFLSKPDGTLLGEVAADQISERSFRFEMTVPDQSFVVEILGNTPGGTPFTRQVRVPISPQSVRVSVSPALVEVTPISVALIEATVSNSSSLDATFNLTANGTLDWPIALSSETLLIPAGGSRSISIEVTVPQGASVSERNEVTVLAEDTDTPQVRNSASAAVVVADDTPSCIPSSTSLCLNQDRFRVEVSWQDFDGNSGSGQVVPFDSEDSGLFHFFDSDNLEMMVKVLDACDYNDRFWVFASAMTNVGYSLTVTDTQTGSSKEYTNPLGRIAVTLADTDAFASCP